MEVTDSIGLARCTDHRCTDGITMCLGCNGYGVLTMGGRKYKLRGQGRNIGATAQVHPECNGIGLAACGCAMLEPVELDLLAGPTVVAHTRQDVAA